MKAQITHYVMALGLVVSCAISARAQAPVVHTTQVLHGGALCHNVIHLIHCHGVNNSIDLTAGHTMLHHSPLGSMLVPGMELGDLEICNVAQVLHEDPACGPRIAVTVKNLGCRKVCNFHISVVALFGPICPTSPNNTVCVENLGPGEALEVMVQLPIEALAMGNRNGQVIGFQRLVVAIDSYDEFVETNEANNLKAFDVATLPVVTPTVTPETVESVSTTTTSQTGAVQEAVVQEVGGTSPTTTTTTAPPADALQTAIQKMNASANAAAAAAPQS